MSAALPARPVVVLAGGTGGARLARGMLDVAPEDLVVVANTADDVEIHGGHVSPDPDLVAFWLSDRIDARGWGLAGDTFAVMDALEALGEEVWFRLGDRDLALCLARARGLAEGTRLTELQLALHRALGVPAPVLPMSDQPVRTWVRSGGRDQPFQEWMVRAGGRAGDVPIEGVELRGAERARLSPEVTSALARARAIVIGPSNPVISIGPILAVPGMREALRASPAAVVAVSPLVAGRAVKGPTEACLRAAGAAPTVQGVAALYAGVIDGLVADERVPGVPVLVADVLMPDPAGRARVASTALSFAEALASGA